MTETREIQIPKVIPHTNFISWEEDATKYGLFIAESDEFHRKYGGRYLVVAIIGDHGSSYFFNEGYIHWSYLKSHLDIDSRKDAKNLTKKLNELIE